MEIRLVGANYNGRVIRTQCDRSTVTENRWTKEQGDSGEFEGMCDSHTFLEFFLSAQLRGGVLVAIALNREGPHPLD